MRFWSFYAKKSLFTNIAILPHVSCSLRCLQTLFYGIIKTEIMAVVIERTDSEFIIKLPLDIDPKDIQDILEYFSFIDIVSRSKATEEDIDELSKDVKSGWSPDIKEKLSKLDEFKEVFD
jgi:hypothetical protein